MAIFNSNHQSHSFSSRIWDPTNDTAQIGISVGDTPWNPKNLQNIVQQCHQVYTNKKIATLSSQEKCDGTYQPGGTMTLALGKWASRVIDQGRDKNLGRWSYLKLIGRYGKQIIVISVYRVCTQECDATSNTATAQQNCILQQLGNTSPNPWKQFIHNLIQQIQAWHTTRKEVILGMDANEDVDHPQSDIMHLFNETDLIDQHTHCYQATQKPATHQCRSHPIDLIARTPHCASAICRAWMLPFGMPPLIKGDHHLLGIDFDTDLLFGNSPTNPMPTTPRGVNSKHKLHVAKFCKESIIECNKHHINKMPQALKMKQLLSTKDLNELELIDSKITESWYQQITGAAHSVAPLGPQLSKQHTSVTGIGH